MNPADANYELQQGEYDPQEYDNYQEYDYPKENYDPNQGDYQDHSNFQYNQRKYTTPKMNNQRFYDVHENSNVSYQKSMTDNSNASGPELSRNNSFGMNKFNRTPNYNRGNSQGPMIQQQQTPVSLSQPIQIGSQQQMMNAQDVKRFKCGKHHREFLNKICIHASCENSPIFCDRCVQEDPLHSTDHSEFIVSIEEFIEDANNIFQQHQTFFGQCQVVDPELLNFVKEGENRVKAYTAHVRSQKKILEEKLRTLIRNFSEQCETKINEIKRTLDQQNETYAKNYDYLSNKIQSFYDDTGFLVAAYDNYFNKECLLAEARNSRNPYDLDRFLRNIKENVRKIATFAGAVTKNNIPKKKMEDDIKAEFIKCIHLIQQQGENPPLLTNYNPHSPRKEGQKQKPRNHLNFYESFNSLMRDIDRGISNFNNNSANFVPIEDITNVTNVFNLLENGFIDNVLETYQQKGKYGSNQMNGKRNNTFYNGRDNCMNNFGNPKGMRAPTLVSLPDLGENDYEEIRQDNYVNNSYNRQENFDVLRDQSEVLPEDTKVTMGNYFHMTSRAKLLFFLEPGTRFLHLFDLKNLKITLPTICDNGATIQHSVDLKQVSLEISFDIPYNHASICTPDGRIIMTGGVNDGVWFNFVYELDEKKKGLMPRKPMNHKRSSHSICMMNDDYLLVVGGENGSNLLRSCEKFNLTNHSWSLIADCNYELPDASICNYNNRYVYRFGKTKTNCIERYSIEKNVWTPISVQIKFPLGTNCESCQINENGILIFGGDSSLGRVDDCFLFKINEEYDEENRLIGGPNEKLHKLTDIKLCEKLYFHCPKSALIYDRNLFAVDYGKQKIVKFNGEVWVALN